MNFRRYIAFGAASLLIHNLAFSVSKPEVTIGSVSEDSGQSLSISFVSVQPPAPKTEVVAEPIEEVAAPVKETPPPPPPEPIVQTPKPVPQPVVEQPKPVEPKPRPVTPPPVREPEPIVKQPEPAIEQPQREEPKREEQTPEEPKQTEVAEAVEQPAEATNEPVSFAQPTTPKLVQNPTFSVRPGPVNYPRIARRRGLEGTVWLEIGLDANARQTSLKIIESSGHSVLDEAALKDVAKWRLSKVYENGAAIAYRVKVPVRFQLN
uniref:energy transducer TonB n=1 Tax=Thaumasiovibrio occultus TaxID=1891184 RepID=UPI000B3630E9|nr:energy transducer TonB [Thaumasiovibrio occultus]